MLNLRRTNRKFDSFPPNATRPQKILFYKDVLWMLSLSKGTKISFLITNMGGGGQCSEINLRKMTGNLNV